MKLMQLYREMVAYRGGNPITPQSQALYKYFTPRRAYANWFEKNRNQEFWDGSRKVTVNDLDKIDTDKYRWFDMRELGEKSNFRKLYEFLVKTNFPIPPYLLMIIQKPGLRNMANEEFNVFTVIKVDAGEYGRIFARDFWKSLDELNYDGIIIRESNTDLKRIGAVDAYVIFTKKVLPK